MVGGFHRVLWFSATSNTDCHACTIWGLFKKMSIFQTVHLKKNHYIHNTILLKYINSVDIVEMKKQI